jgi:hypothetical protein
VDARIGAPGAPHPDRLAQDDRERALELALHGGAAGLSLPAEETRALVLNDEPDLTASAPDRHR